MMTPLALPLDSLLIRLKQNHIAIDPSVRVKVQLVLNRLGKEYLDRPDQLKQILGPVLVNSDAEQELFREVFDQWYREEVLVDEFSEESAEKPNQEDLNVKAKIQKRRIWLYPVAAILIIWVLGMYNYLNRPADYKYNNTLYNEIPVETPEDDAFDDIESNANSTRELGDMAKELPSKIVIDDAKNLVENEKVSFSFDKPVSEEKVTILWSFGEDRVASKATTLHK
ncbi:MAG: hypothetical protein KDE26_21635, partial [Bacteroidetes bacterium]|nr:hypothetical protein [Bacteroidota bacterium]